MKWIVKDFYLDKIMLSYQKMRQERVVPMYESSDLVGSGLETNLFYKLPEVITQKKKPVSAHSIVTEGFLTKWTYLSNVQIPSTKANMVLLTGSNTPKMLGPTARML